MLFDSFPLPEGNHTYDVCRFTVRGMLSKGLQDPRWRGCDSGTWLWGGLWGKTRAAGRLLLTRFGRVVPCQELVCQRKVCSIANPEEIKQFYRDLWA